MKTFNVNNTYKGNMLYFDIPRQVFEVNLTTDGDIKEFSHPLLQGKYDYLLNTKCKSKGITLNEFRVYAKLKGFSAHDKDCGKEVMIKGSVELEITSFEGVKLTNKTLEQLDTLVCEITKERQESIRRAVDKSLEVVNSFPKYTVGNNL